MATHSRTSFRLGFTIVELLIVIVVIGILSAIVIISYNGVQQAARDKTLLSDVEAVATEVTRYSTMNNGTFGSAVAWYSGGAANPNIRFTPSSGNVIDVVANNGLYCIRGYNQASSKDSINNSLTKGNSDDACTVLSASVAAGGTGDASLVGWWKFNGDASDSSGTGYNGGLSEVTSVAGKNAQANGAYSFNGTSSSISVSNKAMTYPMTLSVWYKSNNMSYQGHILHTAETTGDGWGGEFETHLSQNNTAYNFYMKSGTCVTHLSFGTPDLAWHHIVMVVDTTYRAYIDGVLATSGTLSCTPNFSLTTNQLRIGRPVSSIRYLNGTLDDLRVYNKALTLGEVQDIYSANAQ